MDVRGVLRGLARWTATIVLTVSLPARAAERPRGLPDENVEARARWFAMRRTSAKSLSSPYLAFRVVTENACGQRSN